MNIKKPKLFVICNYCKNFGHSSKDRPKNKKRPVSPQPQFPFTSKSRDYRILVPNSTKSVRFPNLTKYTNSTKHLISPNRVSNSQNYLNLINSSKSLIHVSNSVNSSNILLNRLTLQMLKLYFQT